MCLPTAVEPVNEIMSTSGEPVSTSPTAAGSDAVTTLNTPGGMSVSSATSLPIHVAAYGVSGAGFSTTVQPGRERGRDLREVQHEREVPRRDRADDPDGLADDEPVRVEAEELVVAELVLPLVAVDQVDVPLHVVDAGVLLDREREADRRADLGDDLRPQLFLVLVERVLQLLQARLAERPVGRPGGLVERPARRGDGPLHVGGRRVGDRADDRLGRRVDVVVGPGALRPRRAPRRSTSETRTPVLQYPWFRFPSARWSDQGTRVGSVVSDAHRRARPRIELLPSPRRRRAPRRHVHRRRPGEGDAAPRRRRRPPRPHPRPDRRPRGRRGPPAAPARRRAGRARGDRQGDERDPHRRERQRARRPHRGRDRRRGRGHQRHRGGPARLRGGAGERRARARARALHRRRRRQRRGHDRRRRRAAVGDEPAARRRPAHRRVRARRPAVACRPQAARRTRARPGSSRLVAEVRGRGPAARRSGRAGRSTTSCAWRSRCGPASARCRRARTRCGPTRADIDALHERIMAREDVGTAAHARASRSSAAPSSSPPGRRCSSPRSSCSGSTA